MVSFDLLSPISTFNLFFSFLLLLFLLLVPFAKFDREKSDPFVSLASLSHWLFPHGRANFDESLTSYSFHGLIWFYRRINSLARRDFRYARDDDIRSRIFPIVSHFHRILIIGENESIIGLSQHGSQKLLENLANYLCWNTYTDIYNTYFKILRNKI